MLTMTTEDKAAAARERDRIRARERRARLAAQGLTSDGTSPKTRRRGSWDEIVATAARIASSYRTRVTLRQLFYRLVSVGLIRNAVSEYGALSKLTAEARRAHTFPPLLDRTSEVHTGWESWGSPQELLEEMKERYRRDRTEGQTHQVWVVIEKAGLLEQLNQWFGKERGLPTGALSGYASQTDVDTIRTAVRFDGRPAILLYGGDFDPSGEDIYRDLLNRTRCWKHAQRVVLTSDQVDEYGLPEFPAKTADARAAGFEARHGRLVQVEMDALDPNDLRDLFLEAVDAYWDQSAFASVIEREEREREAIRVVDDEDDE